MRNRILFLKMLCFTTKKCTTFAKYINLTYESCLVPGIYEWIFENAVEMIMVSKNTKNCYNECIDDIHFIIR